MGAGSNQHADINTPQDVQQAQSWINGHGFESQYITYFKNSNQQQSSTVEQFTRITSGRGSRDVTFILKTPYDDCRLWEYRSIHPVFYWLLSTPWEYRSINSESYWLLSIRLVGYFMKKLRITHHGFTHTETHLEAMIRRGVQKHSDEHLVYNRRTSNT